MKKYKYALVLLLLFAIIFGCSEGFESEKAAGSQEKITCIVNGEPTEISKDLCTEVGEPAVVSSSSIPPGVSSSSEGISSSVESSSSSSVISSSSSNDISSSSGDDTSSSSTENSSSSSEISSSSVPSSSSALAPVLGECAEFPAYVAKTKKEEIKNLVSVVNNNGSCGNVTYAMGGTPITGDSISFENYSGEQNIDITASVTCGEGVIVAPKTCTIDVFVADAYIPNARCNHEGSPFLNEAAPARGSGINITQATTVIEYACCQRKTASSYRFEGCSSNNYTLRVENYPNIISPAIDGSASLPNDNSSEPRYLPLVPEYYDECPSYYGNSPRSVSPGDTLFHYPGRILMEVTGNLEGDITCNSF